ncbi:hypothetical protein G6L26_027810 (plasmid) [Agrobacterium radiobacter]|uniref:Yne n=2 Tax=Agrobacterium tumefaciens TaxID=358 RepID=A0A2Z2PF96_AGRTU|nr:MULTISPECIES: hypothetical protein [Rhizobium/Agrobacterium group]AKC10998.1 hypothetical protein Ach5_52350 [Agrobacterium tumefaciens]ASK41617.1 hypothetical protein [Agrobacterium tumefaciens]ASK42770.1 hypothetical protein [Agrobacterium sp.]ASK47088.1 hypothetical protein [Agrobacterium radiobacter]AVH45491.1 hypothetical protein At1D1609_54590 [Agrobacterium tumefaciens]
MEHDTTGRTNEYSVRVDEHDTILTPQSKAFTNAELHILVAIAYADQDSLGNELLDIEDLAEYIPAISAEEMYATISDLVINGFINERDIIESRSIRATQLLFETFDAQVMGWNTDADAVELAKLMLANPEHDSPSLAEKT